MSKSGEKEADPGTSNKELDVKVQGVESSAESSNDSGSESESGEVTDSQLTDSTDNSGNSGESDSGDGKSVATDSDPDDDQLGGAAVPLVSANPINVEPNVEESVEVDRDENNVTVNSPSPVFVTPAKSLVLNASPQSKEGCASVAKITNPVTDGEKMDLGKADLDKASTGPATGAIGTTAKLNDHNTPNSTKKPHTSTHSDKTKPAKKSTTKTNKSASSGQLSDRQKEIKYKRKVRKLEAALKLAEKGIQRASVPKKKRGDKQPVGSNFSGATKHSTPTQTSDESDSDGSSDSDQPDTSARIGKLSVGRRFQKLAMSRTKELGAIRDGTIRAAELADALKTINSARFNVIPSHSYKQFRQVPGTGLPHIRAHVRDLCRRYGDHAKSVANLYLLLLQQAANSKRQMVQLQSNNAFTPLWQFQNDLARAPSTSAQPSDPSDQQCNPPAAKKLKMKLKVVDQEQKTPAKSPKKKKSKSESKTSDPAKPAKRASTKDKGDKKKKKAKKEAEQNSEVFSYYS